MKSVDVEFPLGMFVCVTGVSGSGKSSLVNGTLQPILSRRFYKSNQEPLPYKEIIGIENVDDLIEEFGYKEHIKGLFKYEESEYSKKFPKEYKRILSYDLKRIDRRTPFETARDICANFIMEDLFIKPFNDNYKDYLNIKLNENENRDIEKVATNLPDFIFESYTTGKSLRFDLKIDWVGRTIIDKKFFFRGNEYKEYGEKYEWMKETSSTARHEVTRHLDSAFKKFFDNMKKNR